MDSIPSLAQCRSKLQLRFSPWPGNFHMPRCSHKKGEREREKLNRMRSRFIWNCFRKQNSSVKNFLWFCGCVPRETFLVSPAPNTSFMSFSGLFALLYSSLLLTGHELKLHWHLSMSFLSTGMIRFSRDEGLSVLSTLVYLASKSSTQNIFISFGTNE